MASNSRYEHYNPEIKAKGEYMCTLSNTFVTKDIALMHKATGKKCCIYFGSKAEAFLYRQLKLVLSDKHVTLLGQKSWKPCMGIDWRVDIKLEAKSSCGERILAKLSQANTEGLNIDPKQPIESLKYLYVEYKGVIFDKNTLFKLRQISKSDYTALRKLLIVTESTPIGTYQLGNSIFLPNNPVQIKIHTKQTLLSLLAEIVKHVLKIEK